MTKAPLTIIIPCHRDDERMCQAIQSATFAQEIIVIDQQSGVDWKKMKTSTALRVLPHPQLKSFSQMKNEAMRMVTTPWIIFLDSDEYISKQLTTEIEAHLNDADVVGMRLRRLDFFLNKPLFHGETRGATFLRIVKKGEAQWHGSAHEQLVLTSTAANVITLNHFLGHHPHTSITQFIQKIDQYTSLLASEHDERFLLLKMVCFPVCKFIYTFVIRFGFLDGYRGFVYSFLMAIHSNMVRIKRYELHRR